MLKRKWSNKQYCGDVESDPFDFVYRGSVFDPFEESNKVPTIQEHLYCSSTSTVIDTEDLIEDIQLPAHRLSAKVRQQYLYYLDRVLRKNYHTWLASYSNNHNDNPFTDDELRQCAETIEMRAVQACMITSLYRNFILQKIGEIRKQTTLGLIHPNITDVKFKPALIKREQCHVGVQTDTNHTVQAHCSVPIKYKSLASVPEISLVEKMQRFQQNNMPEVFIHPAQDAGSENVDPSECIFPVQKSKQASKTVDLFENPIMESKRPRNEAMDDEIMRELQAMFEPSDEETNIFGTQEAPYPEPLHAGQQFSDPPSTSSPQIDSKILLPVQQPVVEQDLRCSMWPCELHMQRMKLRNLLVKIAEDNYRRYERLVQSQFVTLFGEDDGEEQDLGPYSPTIELNEVLVSSCRQRIAKWVVQALMRPLNDGLIANRFLFKKLAKRLADGIIYANQYPDKKFIRNYVNDYFCSHAQINSIQDIT
ncbi:uncharacterized protein LOC126557942 [Anopheles maculipalpis]|uniref:uncharacterized protein LOC126557942 n=1 Tax=Anopheles maculipalpis TaxID=1496333 RepID=UPI002158A845|nr:uncharacterized protein LOC126557942 [Anopheles maculipalpis]